MAAVDERLGLIVRPETRPFAEVQKGYTFFLEGDVLFAKITPCMQNGKHAIARDLRDGIGFGTTEFHVLRPTSVIIPEWVHYFIRQPAILRAATAYFTGAVGQQRVPETYLSDLEISLPPLSEQKRIAAILNEQMAAVERARAAAEAQLESAKALPASYLRAVFNSPEAQKWPRKRIGDICEIQLGKMLSPASKTGTRPRPYLRNFNVQWTRFDLSDILEMDFGDGEQVKFALRSGDLLVCEGGEPGRAAVWEGQIEPCYYQKALHRLRPLGESVVPYFLMYRLWLGAIMAEFFHSHAKTTIAHLPAVRLAELSVGLPVANEQRRIVANLADQMAAAERTRKALEDQLATIKKLPAALLRRAFSGEV